MQAILILGAAVWQNGPSPTLRRRTAHAASVWKANPDAKVVACGGLGQHPPSEAEVMRVLLIEAGVPAGSITLEDRSTNTLENIRNAARITGAADLLIVTDKYHARRALMVARHFGLRASVTSPLATQSHLKQHVREWFALAAYAVRLQWISRDPN